MGPVLLKRLSDERLGGCLAKGEAAAFDELYRRYSHRLAAYAGNLLDDPAAGDDVAQTALLKAYQALRAGKVPDAVRPWLYRIAHNAAIDLTLRRRELPSDDLPESATERPFSAPLLAAIGALTEHQRRVYVLRELHGLRMDETARELGLSTTQVEQALFAARNRLAEHLVFGERLGCPSVRRLAAGPLDTHERRAIKAHLRACRECRGSLGSRAAVLKWFPVLPLDWLRGILTLGGGAPAAAKLGAVVAATTLAVGVPVAVRTHDLQLATRTHHTAGHRTAKLSRAPALAPAAGTAIRLVSEPVRLTQPLLVRTSPPPLAARLVDHREANGEDKHPGGPATQADGKPDGAPRPALSVDGPNGSGSSGGSSDGGSSDSGAAAGSGSDGGSSRGGDSGSGSSGGGSGDGGSSQGGD